METKNCKLIKHNVLRGMFGSHFQACMDGDIFTSNNKLLGSGVQGNAFNIPFVNRDDLTQIIANYPKNPSHYVAEYIGLTENDDERSEAGLKHLCQSDSYVKFNDAVTRVLKRRWWSLLFRTIDLFGLLGKEKHDKLKAYKAFLTAIKKERFVRPIIRSVPLKDGLFPLDAPSVGDLLYLADLNEDHDP